GGRGGRRAPGRVRCRPPPIPVPLSADRARVAGRHAPVLVGAATASAEVEAAELMAQAVRAAAADSGAASLLAAVDRIAVPQGTWSYPDPARLVADRVGASRARTHLTEL